MGRENAISVQKKKIAAGENLERTRRIELLESSILDEQEKNCWQQKQETNEEDVVGVQGKSCSSKS